MLRDRVMVRHAGSQDKAAYDRELQERPELMRWLLSGAKAADRFASPEIRNGAFGRTEARIDAAVAKMAESSLIALRRGAPEDQPDEAQVHFWRLGFVSAAYETRDMVLGRGAPVPNC